MAEAAGKEEATAGAIKEKGEESEGTRSSQPPSWVQKGRVSWATLFMELILLLIFIYRQFEGITPHYLNFQLETCPEVKVSTERGTAAGQAPLQIVRSLGETEVMGSS